jgi:hypothetical protein
MAAYLTHRIAPFASKPAPTGDSVIAVSRQKPALSTTRLHTKEVKTITTDPG